MTKKGVILSGFSGVLALGVLMGVFVKNASPYVSVAEARTNASSGLHVAGTIEKNSLTNDLMRNEIRFVLKDADGQSLPVVYSGAPVSNLGSATKVVAIGSMQNGQLHSNQLLVKCPSKYEAQKASQ